MYSQRQSRLLFTEIKLLQVCFCCTASVYSWFRCHQDAHRLVITMKTLLCSVPVVQLNLLQLILLHKFGQTALAASKHCAARSKLHFIHSYSGLRLTALLALIQYPNYSHAYWFYRERTSVEADSEKAAVAASPWLRDTRMKCFHSSSAVARSITHSLTHSVCECNKKRQNWKSSL